MSLQDTITAVERGGVDALRRESDVPSSPPSSVQSESTTKPTVQRMKRHPLVRLFGSVRLGITWMALILIYASVASALPQVRGALEMTEMEIFRHWLFVTLCVLLAVSLTVATLTRIKFNRINAGVLTVHTGLLMLIGGSIVYFGTKIEGDVVLRSPRVELVANVAGDERVISQILAAPESSWDTFMPAFGGDVSMSVLKTTEDESGAIQNASIQVQMGDTTPINLELDADGSLLPVAEGRLQARLVSYPAATEFYDSETPTLYVRESSVDASTVLPVKGLPLFRERYLDEGYLLRDREGSAVESKRTSPHVKVAGASVSTGIFEHWRLPIALDEPSLPFQITITGFVPYIADMSNVAVGGGNVESPAINLALSAGGTSREFSLFANHPKDSLIPASVPIEYRAVASVAERDALFRNLIGPHELTIEVKDPPVKKTIAIRAGEVISVEGTPYELSIKDVMPSWPLMTPGYENAASPMASVDVTNGKLSYNRTVIQRFPHLSQDIDEQGVRHREGPYDPNLVLNYRSSANGWMMIVSVPGETPVLGVFDGNGRVHQFDVPIGERQTVVVGGSHLNVEITDYFSHGRRMQIPIIEPLDRRRPNIAARSMSAIRLQFDGNGALDGWNESRWCLFSQYPHVDARPLSFETPDGRSWELLYSRLARDLGVEIAARKLRVTFFPGRQNVESWHSEFVIRDTPDSKPVPSTVYTNETCLAGNWTLFQSGAAQDHWSFTILGVGNRNGIWPMVLGCILITLGCWYAFYVKPILKKRAAQARC